MSHPLFQVMGELGMVHLELGQALLVLGLEVLELVAMAQEVLELGQGVLDLVVWVAMDLAKQDTARHWVELAIDQVKSFTDAYKYFIKMFR